ncbi:MAG: acetyl-CoA carboxylase carboxyltransferase subunit alpha, partial [Candidatus Dadabacteria bacterium]
MRKITHPLEFEREIVQEEERLEALRNEIAAGREDLKPEYEKLEKRVEKLITDVYGRLTPYQRVQLSRHADRPFMLDFVNLLTTDFIELHGDRLYRDDPAIVGGIAKFQNFPVIVVGHQRGRSVQERIKRNFGMPQPEGYRKAMRLFRLAEKFSLPLITFIDTQGAFPGMEAEERGQAEAIARNLLVLSALKTPIISVVIGEGGSGGALALGVADRILMLENACYSVITPEGCASILWHSEAARDPARYASQAAEALRVTAQDLKELGIIDEVVKEPVGGAHRDFEETAKNLAESLKRHLDELLNISIDELVEKIKTAFKFYETNFENNLPIKKIIGSEGKLYEIDHRFDALDAVEKLIG